MAKKLIIPVVIIALLSLAGYYALRGKNSDIKNILPATSEKNTGRQSPANATFLIDGESVTLSNGKNETKIAPESPVMEETSLLDKFAYGDLNSDGKDDTALLLVRYGAGSGTFVYLAVFVSGPVTYHGSNAIFLGDRISPGRVSINNGIIRVEYLGRKSDEPMVAEPTVPTTRQFVYKNGELQEK